MAGRTLRALGVLMLAGFLAACDGPAGTSGESGETGGAQLRITLAVPPDAAHDVRSMLFTVTGGGETRTAVLPLLEQGLSETVDATLAGHRFADWLLAVEPGDYAIVVEPLRSAGDERRQSSEFCAAARGTASVFAGATTEIVLVSQCSVNAGAIDLIGVLNTHPVLLSLQVDPNKHLCLGEAGTVTAEVVDPDGDEVTLDWAVAETPDGAVAGDFGLRPVPDSPHIAVFTATFAGRYEIALRMADDAGGLATVVFPLYVSDCEQAGDIQGRKWRDDNGDGRLDGAETGLAGVTVYVDLNANARPDPGEPRTQTMRDDPVTDFDEGGLYWLQNVRAGRYAVREVVPDGFVQTFPRGGAHEVTVVPGGVVEGIDFGNEPLRTGSIHGLKWRDDDGNGRRDADEPGLPGVVIFVDLNANGVPDSGEPRTETLADDPGTALDESGRYWLEGLQPGRHLVREVVPDGFIQSFPVGRPSPGGGGTDDGVFTVTPRRIDATLEAGEVLDLRVSVRVHPFCVRAFQIDLEAPGAPGTVFENLTGTVQNGCGGEVSQFLVRLTGDGNAHAFDIRFVDAEFGGLLARLPVAIAVTSPGGAHVVVLESGDVVEGVDFGNQPLRPGSIQGLKWLDTDADGVRDDNERGLAGVTVYADLNGNGAFEAGEPATETLADDPDTAVDEAGRYWLEGLEPGRYLVREVVPDGFAQTFPATVPPRPGGGVDNGFFVVEPRRIDAVLGAGDTLLADLSLTIVPLCVRPYELDLRASGAPPGVFENLDPPQINGCGGDTTTFGVRLTGDGAGHAFDIQFVDVEFGGVVASLPATVSPPGASGAHVVRVGNGTVIEGVDFGNRRLQR